jgi:hypothetical protein
MNHVSSDTAHEAPEVIIGTFNVHSTPAISNTTDDEYNEDY